MKVISNIRILFSSLGLLTVLFSTTVTAIEPDNPINSNQQVLLEIPLHNESSILNHILNANQASQATTALVLDDGTAENSIGDSGQFIWFNRFTPDPTDFPFQLEEVSVMFGTTEVNVNDPIEILVYQDTDGDGNPGTGAVLLATINETVQFNDQATFSVFLLDTPVLLNGPGDVLLGVVNKAGSEGFNDFPAALDQATSFERSWAATYNVGDVPTNPTLPADEQWGTIDSFGLPGNWLIHSSTSFSQR